MKKKFKKNINKYFTLFTVLLLLTSNIVAIDAATFSIGVSSTSVEVGDTVYISASINDEYGSIQVKPSVSGNLQVTGGVGPSGEAAASQGGSISIKVKVNGPGTITTTGFAEDINGEIYSANRTFTISIKAPPANDGNTWRPSDSQEQEKQTATQQKPAEKTQAQIEAEKKAAEQAEEDRKAAELEERKVTPLFSEINIISNSEKMMGDTLETIASVKETFEYSYTLPKRIEAFALDLKTLDGATLTYEKDHTILEGETSVVIPVLAVMDEISQEFKITVSKNTDKAVVVTVGEKDLEIYDDELLDAAMTALGFEKATLEQGETQVPYFVKGAMSLALLQEGESVSWYALSDTQEFTNPGALYLDEENNALFILQADEEVSAKRLYQNAYSEKTLDAKEELAAVDSSLNFSQTYKSWQYDETREVVYGFDESGDKDFYVFGDKQIKAAVVGFDAVDKTYQMISWGLGGVLFSLVGTGSLFALAQKKNGKKEDDVLEEDYIEA